MHMQFKANLLATGVFMALCGSAWALDPQPVYLTDGLTFTPTLKVAERYEDNFRGVETGEQSSWITGITPTFVLAVEDGKSAYALSYVAESDIFHSSQSDNNTDHHLTADAGYIFNSRNRLQLDVGYHRIEDTAAENQSTNSGGSDKYSTRNLGGLYSYGVQSAQAQVDFSGDYEQRRYHNSGELNAGLERDTTALASTFYYRVAPKTRALFEARHTDYDYISNTDLNSNNIALLGGVTWDATAKTSGTVKIGAERKRFDDSQTSDKSAALWEVTGTWQPRTYSTFNLSTRRGLDESDDSDATATASSIQTQRTSLDWEHQWLDRLTSEISYSYTDKQYQGINRDDQLVTLGLGLTYEMRRWLDVGVGYRYLENDSSLIGESYERNIFSVSFTASL